MHISRFSADKALINLTLAAVAAKLTAIELVLHRAANPVIHEPRGFLGYAQRPRNLATADAILAIRYEPHRNKPLVQTEWAILEDRAYLNRELPPRVMAAALPLALLLKEADFRAATSRAFYNAIRPAPSRYVITTILRVREVQYSFLECFGLRVHVQILLCGSGFVNYIIAL